MKQQIIKTQQDVRNEFYRKGISMASWARDKGFNKATVSLVLSGKCKATRGVGHKIAVALGIKDGEIVDE